MDELQFLKAMLDDSENHSEAIRKRIKQIEKSAESKPRAYVNQSEDVPK